MSHEELIETVGFEPISNIQLKRLGITEKEILRGVDAGYVKLVRVNCRHDYRTYRVLV